MDIPKYYEDGGKVAGLDFQQREAGARKIVSLLGPDKVVLEFGSGASTVFYPQFAKKWISIESCREWFDIIKPKVPANVEMISAERTHSNEYMPPEKDIEEAKKRYAFQDTEFEISKPYCMGKTKDFPVLQYLRHVDFVEAVKQIKEKVDLVFVDSRAKVFCALAAVSVLKPDGVIVVHDWSRSEYRPLLDYFEMVEAIEPPAGDLVVLKPKKMAAKPKKTAKKKLPPTPEVSLQLPKKKKARKKKA